MFRREMFRVNVPAEHLHPHLRHRPDPRQATGKYFVLEDNGRTPSGVSYVLENRAVMKRVFPALFSAVPRAGDRGLSVQPAADASSTSPPTAAKSPTIAVLTPGIYNSAYFEHSFLARQMGVELVEGRDLIVDNDFVYMRTTAGLRRVDVIYRRVDDDFLDPLCFRPDSALGVAGLMNAYRMRQRGAGQRRRDRRGRRQGDLPVRPGHDQVLPGAGADPAQRADVHLRRATTTANTSWSTCTSWS